MGAVRTAALAGIADSPATTEPRRIAARGSTLEPVRRQARAGLFAASRSQVSTTVSGLSDMDSMP